MNLITKVASVGGAIGIVGGTVVFAKHYYQGFTDINARLEGFGYEVLNVDTNQEEEWKKLESAYKQEKREEHKFKEQANANLKEHCRVALEESPNDEKAYNLARRWCVKETTVKALLQKNNYTQLEKTSTKAENKSKWMHKITELRDDKDATIKIDIDFSEDDMDILIQQLEKACDSLMADEIKTHNQDDFEKKFIQARTWCALNQEEASK